MASVIRKALLNWRAGHYPMHALRLARLLGRISKLQRRLK
jgi:hypothetical protein